MSRCKWGKVQWHNLLSMPIIKIRFNIPRFRKKTQIKIVKLVIVIIIFKVVAVRMVIKMLLNKYKSKRKKVKIIYWKILSIKVIMKIIYIKSSRTIILRLSKILNKIFNNKLIFYKIIMTIPNRISKIIL